MTQGGQRVHRVERWLMAGIIVLLLLLAVWGFLRWRVSSSTGGVDYAGGQLTGSADLGMILQCEDDGGLYVLAVTEHGAAADAGILAGDHLTALNAQPLTASDDMDQLLTQWDGAEPLTVTVARTGCQFDAQLLPAHP